MNNLYLNKVKNLPLKLYAKYQELITREEGQDLIEYALLASLLAVVCVATIGKVGNAINGVFGNVLSDL